MSSNPNVTLYLHAQPIENTPYEKSFFLLKDFSQNNYQSAHLPEKAMCDFENKSSFVTEYFLE